MRKLLSILALVALITSSAQAVGLYKGSPQELSFTSQPRIYMQEGTGYTLIEVPDTDSIVLAGDANLDGMVTGIDLGILAKNWNATGGWDKGNFTSYNDDIVNGLDLGMLAKNWRARYEPTAPPPSPMPEPITLITAALGVGGLLRYTSRRV